MDTILEIRQGTGGKDSKMLVNYQFGIYNKAAQRNGLWLTVLEEREGFLSFLAEGKDAHLFFQHEAGGIKVHRCPPTEKRGRIHTSTITVAVLPVPKIQDQIKESDIDFRTTRSSGNGGQHIQKTDSAVIATHIPTGISVRCENERSQHKNKAFAVQFLSAKVAEVKSAKAHNDRNSFRKEQIGSGARSETMRTVRMQDNKVVCERTGNTKSLKEYERGNILF